MEIIKEIFQEFTTLMITVLPYFFLGTAFGAFLKSIIVPEAFYHLLSKGMQSVVLASILGAVLPGCACSTIPMAEGLKAGGARLGTTTAFIMVSPLLAPQTVILTHGLLGIKVTIARILFSMFGAILLGVSFNYLENNRKVSSQSTFSKFQISDCQQSCGNDGISHKEGFWKNFVIITKDLGKYFLIGMFIAGILSAVMPEDAVSEYIGSSGPLAYLFALLIGVPLYVCEGEEIPITYSLLKLGLGKGPSLTFLLGSVGTCIPTIFMAQRVIGKGPTVLYLLYWLLFALISGMIFSIFS